MPRRDAAPLDAAPAASDAGRDARATDARGPAACPICERLLRCCEAANAANTCDPPCVIVEGQLEVCRMGGGSGLDSAALEAGCAHSLMLYQQSRPELEACKSG